tara:strand:- start:2245 stop:2511 length:267 start_codon:yes stop_codon:yes gene_type:complete
MEVEEIRTCEIKNLNLGTTSVCKLLRNQSGKFSIQVVDDPEGLFTDFVSIISKNHISAFEKECIQRFTCRGLFSLLELKQEGEIIYFY